MNIELVILKNIAKVKRKGKHSLALKLISYKKGLNPLLYIGE